jgi:hypothetical protein
MKFVRNKHNLQIVQYGKCAEAGAKIVEEPEPGVSGVSFKSSPPSFTKIT